jgi:hypothetical protein
MRRGLQLIKSECCEIIAVKVVIQAIGRKAKFPLGICPNCLRALYPDFAECDAE